MFSALATNTTAKQSAVSDVPEEYIGSLADMIATYSDKLPDHVDAVVLTMAAGFFAGVASILFVVWGRRPSIVVSSEPLLGA